MIPGIVRSLFKNLKITAEIKRFEIDKGWTEEIIYLYNDEIEIDNKDLELWTNQ